jgi:ribonuclease Z
MLMLSSQVDRDDPLYVIGPPRIAEYIETSRRVLEMYINFEIRVVEIEDPRTPQTVYDGDGFSIQSFPLRHSRTCVGYTLVEHTRPGQFFPEKAVELGVPRGPLWSRLQDGESVTVDDRLSVHPEDVLGAPRRGRKFTYMTDTLPLDSVIPHIADSDLLISEGMFTDEHRDTAYAKKHMTAADAAKLAARAGGILRMGLIHYSPRFTNRQLKQLVTEAREHFPDTFLTRDRMQLDIPYRE